MMKITLLGATGLIGSHIVDSLCKDKNLLSVNLLVRRPIDITHPKIHLKVIDFEDIDAFKSAIAHGSHILCSVGTTQKKVGGNREKYRKVDYDIPVNAAQLGIEKECKSFSLVSAVGASAESSNFYTKLKGEVEDKISSFAYESIYIYRPSLLMGERSEFRLGERIAQAVMGTFSFLIPKKYKPIQAKTIAKAMLTAIKNPKKGPYIYTYKEIHNLLKN